MNEITDFPYELQTSKALRWSTNPRFKFCSQKHQSDHYFFRWANLASNFSKFFPSKLLFLCTAASFGSKFLRWATLQVLESLQPPISMGSKQSTNTSFSLQTLQTNYCSVQSAASGTEHCNIINLQEGASVCEQITAVRFWVLSSPGHICKYIQV